MRTAPSCSGSNSLALTPIFHSGAGTTRSHATTQPQFEQRTNRNPLRPQLYDSRACGSAFTCTVDALKYAHRTPYLRQMEQLQLVMVFGRRGIATSTAPQ